MACSHPWTRNLIYRLETKEIVKKCLKCSEVVPVAADGEEAKRFYPEHLGCGGLLIKQLNNENLHLMGACTKCDYQEDRQV
jgi:hypothetical protein